MVTLNQKKSIMVTSNLNRSSIDFLNQNRSTNGFLKLEYISLWFAQIGIDQVMLCLKIK